jgi:hypothetical protein
MVLTLGVKNKKIAGLVFEFKFGEILWLTVYQLVNGHVSQNPAIRPQPMPLSKQPFLRSTAQWRKASCRKTKQHGINQGSTAT